MKTTNRSRRRALLTSAAAPAIALALWAGSAAAQEPAKTFAIAPQPLADALLQLSRQADIDIVASTDLTRGRTAPRVSGEMTTADAMSALLAGSGLIAAPSGAGYVITRASDPQSGSAAGDGADGTVQALIVTAQKREENIQDVPIAMSAFTQEALERSQVAGGPDLMTQVPNMTFTKTNFTSYSIQIRGIGTQAISATTDNAVAVAFNNTPFIRNRFFEQEFYDLQRVEVLRGPQGTLYGRNATAGVVNLISQKPKFTYEAKLSADVANYSSTRLEGMINLPLVEDKVALRLAGAWTKREGYSTNEITGNPIDGRDLWSTRASLRIVPNDRLDANLIWEHFQEDDDRLRSGKQLCHTHELTEVGGIPVTHYTGLGDFGQTSGEDLEFGLKGLAFSGVQGTLSQGCAPASLYSPDSFEVPNGLSVPYYGPLGAQSLPIALTDPYLGRFQSRDLRMIESTVDPLYKANTDTVELQLNYDLSDALTLTSETAYAVDEIFSTQDFNRFNTAPGAWDASVASWVNSGILSQDGVFCDPQIGCADRLVGIDVSTARSRHFSQEFRVGSSYDGPFNFSLGANFLRYDTEDKYYVMFNSLTMYAASQGFGQQFANTDLPPYQSGVTDNYHCMPHGNRPPEVTSAESILGCVPIDPNPITSLNDLGHNYFLSKNPYKLISYAIFGEAYYNITDALKVTAGLRWTVDRKQAPRIPSWVLGADYAGYSVAEVVNQEWREPTGRLAIDWKPHISFTDETLLYASYAHGYKAGGMNPPPAGLVIRTIPPGISGYLESSATHPRTFAPEFIDAFEVGSKNTLLDGSLTMNMAGFYYDYKGYQISQIVNRSAVNLNFDAQVWGLELESDWRLLENFKLGLKLGYENTKVADDMRAIDTMDRTAGDKAWVVVSPFPTQPSNCVLPTWLFIGNYPGRGGDIDLVGVGGQSGGNPGGCEDAYILGADPGSTQPFTVFPNIPGDQGDWRNNVDYAAWSTDPADYPCWPTAAGPAGSSNRYPGVDPACLAALSNNGQGMYKDLSGNELPNAPHYTATITADYTLPLPNDWLATLHTDLYYQSEAWTRIFNTEGYDKLKAYSNINLAAIFTNEDAGWKVMAYVKNVLDRDSITGAFLNSDDTGLTTNVFLTEPRLYGLRVTKEWNGGSWWTGANSNHTGPYPLTVELGGQVQRQDAAYATLASDLFADFPETLDPTSTQHRDLDWGDGREVKLTYRPEGSMWSVSAAMRYGRTNTDTARLHSQVTGERVCAVPMTGPYAPYGKALCDPTYSLFGSPPGYYYNPDYALRAPVSWSDGSTRSREEHTVVDFDVGRDVGIGALGTGSSVSLGVRYAHLKSDTAVTMAGVPYEYLPEGWRNKYIHSTRYDGSINTHREFKGAGPLLNWSAGVPILGNDETGHLNIGWSLGGGVLFGKQKTQIEGQGYSQYHASMKYGSVNVNGDKQYVDLGKPERTKSVSVPVLDLSLGLSYDIQRIRVSTGYRWERYFNAVDAGYAEREQYDRTIDGPYFKVSVGFGG